MLRTPVEGHPSSDSSGLGQASVCKITTGPWSTKGGARLTETTPCLAVAVINFEDLIQILYCLWEILAGPQNGADGVHCWDGVWVCAEALLVGEQGVVNVAENF